MDIVYVQTQLCGRAWKAAKLSSQQKDINVHLIELSTSSKNLDYSLFKSHYNIPIKKDVRSMVLNKRTIIKAITKILEVNIGNYDIIHTHNGPDHLGAWIHNYLRKPIIHDIHDVSSLSPINFGSVITKPMIRYLYNKWEKSVCMGQNTIIVPSVPISTYIMKKYHNNNINVIENKPLKQKVRFLKKINSGKDNEIHFVYAGSLSFGDNSPRDTLPIFNKIAKDNFYVHIYPTVYNEEFRHKIVDYCKKNPNLKYHQPVKSSELITELTQYDFGLLVFANCSKNILYSSPNKLYEYLAAKLPIIINFGGYNRDYIEKNNYGFYIQDPKEIGKKIKAKEYDINIHPDNLFLNPESLINIYRDYLNRQ